MNDNAPIDLQDNWLLLEQYRKRRRLYELFLTSVEAEFLSSPELNTGVPTVIHSIRKRLKDEDHLAEKIERKRREGKIITKDNLFSEIQDFAGIRILHLYQNQFVAIHEFVVHKVTTKNWRLLEKPIAYTWDPESVAFFRGFKINPLNLSNPSSSG